ncbi:S-adenosylmethionine-dependent methyltransferase [Thiothrix caldifontis]|uniref:tRNA 5-carboxymethoxyuridine methyltransferase n=1 Tax=Thiothrix caldifontis TaxID=525918 RepID=A0A1H3X7P4_9GAMM|nr:methyltransferase domain-containing protein [Thiothrix caldifontis]SDZ95435.1 S-adenosylmethionine-dependent methyltransferase [Thiothrix caldifontis]
MQQDRIFDGLAQRFQRSIYDDPRGAIRLAILQDDLQPFVVNTRPLKILDAGGGLGQMAIWLAQQGHQVVLAEPSAEMLQRAATAIAAAGLQDAIHLLQASVQELAAQDCESFDLITFHAVLEWLAEPRAVLAQLLSCLKPEGWLSLMFFNHHSTVMRRLIAGDLDTVRRGEIASDGKRGLAPISPLKPDEVLSWLAPLGLELDTWSGVRCFYDYMYRDVRKAAKLEEVLPLERQYSQQEPWRSLARYQHMLCRKLTNDGV